MTITALPAPPEHTDSQAAFNSKAFAWVAALGDFVDEANQLAVDADADAATAAAAALTATTKAADATAAAASASAVSGAVKWVSGTTYTEGACVWSPSNFQTYRRKTTGGGTTDPSADSTNWTRITADLSSGLPMANLPITGIKTATFDSQPTIATTTGAVTIDWSTGQCQKQAEPTGNITYTFTAPPGPCHLQLLVDSDGTTTARTFTWPASVKWLSVAWAHLADKRAVINFWYDGTNYFATGANEV